MTTTPRWFRPSTPSAAARSLLTCRWTAAFDGAHLLVPDGSMDIVWIEGRGLHLCGPDTHSWTVSLPPSTACIGIRFHPGAAASVLRIDADEVLDRQVPLDAIVGSRRARVVDEQLTAAPGASRVARLEHLALELGERSARRPSGAPDRSVQHAVASLRVADHRIDRLADRTGLSARQLQRRFVRHVGYPPSRFARVARLQRFLHLATLESDEHLADLAARSGYADQSHLVRECRSITGLTPSRLRSIAPATSYAPTRVDDGVRSVQAEHRRGARRSAA